MRILAITKIFPNALEPTSAPFNRLQFRALADCAELEVLATIPWFPAAKAFQKWSSTGRLEAVPAVESIDGLTVRHPRFAYLPKFGSALAGPLYVASLAPHVLRYRGRVDVVLGSWAYPDGYAAVVLAGLLGVPAVVKVHGSDLNVVARLPGAQRHVAWTLSHASRVVAVSRPLADAAVELGAPADRVDLVRNGIDRERFHPRDRAQARAKLGLAVDGPIVLYVGHVSEAKGALDLIRAFGLAGQALGGVRLVMVGDGAGLARSAALARELHVEARLVGAEPHERVPLWLAAADVLALPSWNEGMPNVVLEALASGRRVVATTVGGIPDVVTSPTLGTLVPPRDATALSHALVDAVNTPYDAEEVARASGTPTWSESARGLYASLLRALETRATGVLSGAVERAPSA